MKRTSLLLIAALFAAVFTLSASAQAAPPENGPAPAAPKYEVAAGFAYTSLNQVNLSRSGLMGGRLSLTRDWGKYFGVRAQGDYFKPALKSSGGGNPGDPSVSSFIVGPELHSNVYGPIDGLVFAGVGAEHTGGEQMSPDTSFAGDFGIGFAYRLGHRLAIQAIGDRIGGSFSLINNAPGNAYSPHLTWNARAFFGVSYKF